MNRAYWLHMAREESLKAEAILAGSEIQQATRDALTRLIDDLADFEIAIGPNATTEPDEADHAA